MSERGIIFVAVGALIAGAFVFPYENDDDYYARHQKKPNPPKQLAAGEKPVDGNAREVEIWDLAEKYAAGIRGAREGPEAPARDASKDAAGDAPGDGGIIRGVDRERAVPIADQTPAARLSSQSSMPPKQGGFAEGRRLQGTWVQVFDDAAAAGARPNAEPATLTFCSDGTFTEHLLISTSDISNSPTRPRVGLCGRYVLHGYTLTIVRSDAQAANDPSLAGPADYTICALAGDAANGMPARLLVDGKVLKYRD